MTNSRAKGREQEQIFARWLTQNGWPTKRRLAGNGQAGDLMIADAPDVVVDVKARSQWRLKPWLDQLVTEADGRPHMTLVAKVPGVADPGRWLAVVPSTQVAHVEIHREVDLYGPLDASDTAAVLGWLQLEADVSEAPEWCAGVMWETPYSYDWNWHLLLASTWREFVLPVWSDPEAVAS